MMTIWKFVVIVVIVAIFQEVRGKEHVYMLLEIAKK